MFTWINTAISNPARPSAKSAWIFHWVKDASTYPAQRKVLEYFIAATAEQNKFVNLHTKAGEREILDLLEKRDCRRAIIHWYSGRTDILKEMIDYGCYFTIGVEVLYSDTIKGIAKTVPTISSSRKPTTLARYDGSRKMTKSACRP